MERRDVALQELKVDGSGSEPGTFSGYGAYFGNVDAYGDVIERGAFAESLEEWKARGKWPPMLLQHGGFMNADDMVPVGKWTSMEENSRGLKVEGRLYALNTDRGQYIYEGLKSGDFDGLSIGFETVESRFGTKPGEPERTLTKIKLWEVSLVTFPANPKARVTSVKTLTVEQLRDLETSLRDGGLSHKDCVRAVSVFKQWLQRDAGVPGNTPSDLAVPDDDAELAEMAARRLEEMLYTAAIKPLGLR